MERLRDFRSSFWFYDIIGYLLPGFFFVCLVIIDYDLSTLMRYNATHEDGLVSLRLENIHFKMKYFFNFLTWNTDSDFKFTTVLVMLILCYVFGHIIAAISSYFIESLFNNKLLKFPSENLLDNTKRNWFQKIFKNYTRAFDPEFAIKFKKIFELRFGSEPTNKNVFWLCYADISNRSPMGFNRVTHFVNLYGFSRNIAASLIIYVFLRILVWIFLSSNIDSFTLSILVCYILCALIMTKNYLKLYYRQCVELYYHFYSLHTDEELNSPIQV